MTLALALAVLYAFACITAIALCRSAAIGDRIFLDEACRELGLDEHLHELARKERSCRR